jgi:hypothetical protein
MGEEDVLIPLNEISAMNERGRFIAALQPGEWSMTKMCRV